MKKLLSIILTLLMLVGILASCGNYESPDDDKDLDNQDKLDTVAPDDDTKDFPFDNIVIERNGYDLVAGGRYYGKDFDNVKYYGSYYRIIDNYDDFSTLTAWGNKIDKSVFNDNFILVLHTYKPAYDTYYTHSKYNDLNGKGRYRDFGINESGTLVIFEGKSGSDRAVVGEEFINMEDYEVTLPIETQETIYLVIPRSELPFGININGEIFLVCSTIIDL